LAKLQLVKPCALWTQCALCS